jgi:transglutaminase-like putative cysteine protease
MPVNRILRYRAIIGLIICSLVPPDLLPGGGMPGTAAAAAHAAAADLSQLESAIAAAMLERRETVSIDYTGDGRELTARIKDVIMGALKRDDYTSYIVDSYFYSIRTLDGRSHIRLTLNYRETPEQTAEVDRQVREVLDRLVTPEMNDHQRVKAIHDWIVLRLAYDVGLSRYTAYEALRTGRAVCQGYALLAYRMLNAAGIPARIVEGAVPESDHAWNLVRVDGRWYHLDVTWDDPVPDRNGAVSYDYYLKTDEEIRKDHAWTRAYPCADTPYREAVAAAKRADPGRAGFYESLEAALGWKWLRPEHTSATPDDLRRRLEEAAASGADGFKVRYLRGDAVRGDLKRAAAEAKAAGVRAFEASIAPFGEDGAVLLEVSLIR